MQGVARGAGRALVASRSSRVRVSTLRASIPDALMSPLGLSEGHQCYFARQRASVERALGKGDVKHIDRPMRALAYYVSR